MRSKLLIGLALAGVVVSSGVATAQVADDPPGSAFQTQGIREDLGQRATPSVFSRTARAAALAHAFAYIPVTPQSSHKVVRPHR